jgi:hypothetical protein
MRLSGLRPTDTEHENSVVSVCGFQYTSEERIVFLRNVLASTPSLRVRLQPCVIAFSLAVASVSAGSVASQGSMSLADASASFVGEQARDEAGCSVAGVGDLDGDGLGDFVIGAWGHAGGAGKVYLILGQRDGWRSGLSLAEADAAFEGEASEDFAGLSVAGLGDVNGDQVPDFAVGAQGNDQGGQNCGKTYLMFGKREIPWGSHFSLANADVSILGAESRDFAPFTVSGAGDVNGDGLDDILIAAPRRPPGQVFLIMGRARAEWPAEMSLASADASFLGGSAVGPAGYDATGFDVAGAGDVNGDGLDDFLIGAPLRDSLGPGSSSGQAYLILGRREGWKLNTSLASADVTFLPEAPYDRAGTEIAGAGDVNGDSFDDFLIAAPSNTEGGGEPLALDGAGQTYLILGHSGPWGRTMALSQASASFVGGKIGQNSGTTLTGVSDVNGDRLSDFLIGSPRDDTVARRAGEASLFLGRRAGWALDTPLSQAATTFLGEGLSDEASRAMAGVGDVNGDGHADIVIGTHFNSESGYHAGKVYLILAPVR